MTNHLSTSVGLSFPSFSLAPEFGVMAHPHLLAPQLRAMSGLMLYQLPFRHQ